MGSNFPTPKKTQKKSHVESTPPPPSHRVLKRKTEIGVSTASNSSSPSAKKTENTKKWQSNVKSTLPLSPSVVCVPSPQSQTKQKKRTPPSPDVLCVSSPQPHLHVGKQTDKHTPTRASERHIVSAGQPMPTNSRKRKSNVKSTPASPNVVCISSPQLHLHVAGKQTEKHAPTRSSKRCILSAGQSMPMRANFVYNSPRTSISTRLRYNPLSPDW